jgi:hypothetical protein
VALARVRRIVRAGGVLRLWDVVYDLDPAEAEERIESWCATDGRSVEGAWSRSELEEHVRDEYSTFRWLLEPMLDRYGFAIEDVVYSQDGILFSASTLRVPSEGVHAQTAGLWQGLTGTEDSDRVGGAQHQCEPPAPSPVRPEHETQAGTLAHVAMR